MEPLSRGSGYRRRSHPPPLHHSQVVKIEEKPSRAPDLDQVRVTYFIVKIEGYVYIRMCMYVYVCMYVCAQEVAVCMWLLQNKGANYITYK